MYHVLSVLSGILITLMIAANGELGAMYGVYSATVMIHVIGLILISLLLVIRRRRFFPAKKIPFQLFLGGAVGVGTVVFNNLSFGRISVSAILALSLLGQTLTSLTIDQLGLFQMPKHPFSMKKLPGIVLVIVGIAWMLWPFDVNIIVPVILSLLSGVTIVVSRSINACLACKTGMLQSTFFNYAVGLTLSAAILFIAGTGEPLLTTPLSLSPRLYIYSGGLMGVFVVTLLNAIVSRISSLYATLLLFIGQVFSGVILDGMLSGSFSFPNMVGGTFVAAGLAACMLADRKAGRQNTPCCPANGQ